MKRAGSMAVLLLALTMTLTLAACGSSETDSTTTVSSGGRVFTLDELSGYDGKDGAKAYVAVDGAVYDVTGSRIWPEGAHGTCGLGASAGRDLSEIMRKAPSNMRALLEKMPVVGELAQ